MYATRYKIQDTRYKIQDTLKHVLIIGFITTLLFTTVTCGSEGNAGTVDITQADVDRLQSNWQQTLDDLGVLLPNNTYTFDLLLKELYTGTITSTENLTISLTSSTNGITISPSNATLPFNEALDASWPQMLTIDETVEVGQRYSITVSLSSQILDETFTFDLFFIIETTERLEITQTDVDNFGNMVKDLLAAASGNFIQAGNSFTLTLSLFSLYPGEPLTITFTSLHPDVTVSPTSYEATTSAGLNLEWTITYSEESSPDMTYNINISIMSESLSSTLSTTLDLPSPIDTIFDLGVGISPSLSLTGTKHVPVLVLSNIPRRSDFTYTLEQADDAIFSNVTTTTLAYSDIVETTFEYVLDVNLTSSDWGSTLTDHQFYRLSVYDSNNRFLTGGNTSDITEIVYSTFVGNVSAVGDGLEATPYQISNVYQLQEMGTPPNLDKYFVLVGNINATETVSWADGAGFNPIDACVGSNCNTAEFFKGSLDGRGYTISNLYINRRDMPAIGLFGAVGGTNSQTATIENLTLSASTINATITGTETVTINSDDDDTTSVDNIFSAGSFVGYMDNYTELANLVVDTFSSSSFSSSFITAVHALSLGGLVGRMVGGSISFSSSSLRLSSLLFTAFTFTPLYLGGLVGDMLGGSLSSSISYSTLSYFTSRSSSSPVTVYLGGLLGNVNGGSALSSNISYSTLSYSSSHTFSLTLGGLVGRIENGTSLSSSISYSIFSLYNATIANAASSNGVIGSLIGILDSSSSLSSSISHSIFSYSHSFVANNETHLGGLVGEIQDSNSLLHSSLDIVHLWSIQRGEMSSNLGSLSGSNSGTVNNSYIDTGFLIFNENDTLYINPSTSELPPFIDDNSNTVNCIVAFTYSDNLSATSGSDCSDTDLFYNFATYDSNDEGTEPDWDVSDTSFYPRPATMPSMFDLSQLATQNEYRMVSSHPLIRFYDGVPIDNNADDSIDNASNVLFIKHNLVAVTSVDDLEEVYYEVNTNNIYISQGLDATLLRDDNTLYTSATDSTKFTYSFGLARYRTSISSSNSIIVNGITLTINQDATGTYISGINSLGSDDDFYIEVTVNSSTSVTTTGNNTSFSRRYRFKKIVPSVYLSQIRFESRNTSSVVTYENDTESSSITIAENPKSDSDVTFTFSDAVSGQAGFVIVFSNTVTCSGGYRGESVSGFTNTDTVLIDARRINYCSADLGVSDTPTQMIIIPEGAFVSQDGTPLPKITIQFSIDT